MTHSNSSFDLPNDVIDFICMGNGFAKEPYKRDDILQKRPIISISSFDLPNDIIDFICMGNGS